MTRDIKKICVTSCPTFGLWFERFILEILKRIGDEMHQDQAIALGVIYKLIEGLDFEFS